jgi:hypothetical protein
VIPKLLESFQLIKYYINYGIANVRMSGRTPAFRRRRLLLISCVHPEICVSSAPPIHTSAFFAHLRSHPSQLRRPRRSGVGAASDRGQGCGTAQGVHEQEGVASHRVIATCTTPDLFLKHSDENVCNIRLKTHETLETCVCNHCNMCNK